MSGFAIAGLIWLAAQPLAILVGKTIKLGQQ